MRWPSTMLTTIGALDHATWLRYTHQAGLPPEAITDYLADHGHTNTAVIDTLQHATATDSLRLLLMANATVKLHDDLAHHGLSDLAAQVYLSAASGYATPDPRALEYVLRTESLNPDRTLYIDVDHRSVDAAHQLGLRAHTYTGIAPLRHVLANHGELPQPGHTERRGSR